VGLIADEEVRHALYLRNRESRAAFRAQLEASLHGNTSAARLLRDDYQPLIEAALDMQLPDQPDDPDSKIVVNQNLNLS
jgi:hypothetical protein